MKEKLKRMLTNNLGLKILSVVLALFTWLIMVNVSNPMMTVTHTVPVEFINEEVLIRFLHGFAAYVSIFRHHRCFTF